MRGIKTTPVSGNQQLTIDHHMQFCWTNGEVQQDDNFWNAGKISGAVVRLCTLPWSRYNANCIFIRCGSGDSAVCTAKVSVRLSVWGTLERGRLKPDCRHQHSYPRNRQKWAIFWTYLTSSFRIWGTLKGNPELKSGCTWHTLSTCLAYEICTRSGSASSPIIINMTDDKHYLLIL